MVLKYMGIDSSSINLEDRVELVGKAVSKFCAKFLHQQVLRHEVYLAGDIATSLQKSFLRNGNHVVPQDQDPLVSLINIADKREYCKFRTGDQRCVKEALESSESDVVVKLNPDKGRPLHHVKMYLNEKISQSCKDESLKTKH
ncbi:hypothetical protein KIW84_021109 [Lathyrus oleraceus]|uniref:Uncharacterized protein n=1 Tax=Pisum sativum TaxID=3888 RepID=A0A9D4Y986_PEA|nr:hypothetical protein KIW84_021109 [Pisum sativum]